MPMDIKDLMCWKTREAVADLFEAARKTPEDKLNWKPLDGGRSVLNQLQECALSPSWGAGILKNQKAPEFTPELMAEFGKMMEALKTIDECEAKCLENLAILDQTIRTFPDSEWEKTVHLPFGRVHDWPFYDVAMLHYWNCTYHLGQITYIQLLLENSAVAN